jgi:hypothetical protein
VKNHKTGHLRDLRPPSVCDLRPSSVRALYHSFVTCYRSVSVHALIGSRFL